MPRPTLGDVHVNRPLTNVSVAYIQADAHYIAGNVFPLVPVLKKSDAYFVYDREWWLKSEAKLRAPGTESAGADYSLSTATYDCLVNAIHHDVDDQTAANSDEPLRPEVDASQWVTQQLLLKREKDWVTGFFATSLWTGGTSADPTPSPKWDVASGTPIEDITAQSISIAQKTGFRPNVLVLGPQAYDKLRHHPDILDRIKYTQKAVATPDILASLFDVERVYVPYVTENTAAEYPGAATGTYAYVYGKAALLVYAAPSPGLKTPSGGYTFAWTGFAGASAYGTRIKSFYLQQLESTRVEGEMAYAHKVVGADLGCYFQSVVS